MVNDDGFWISSWKPLADILEQLVLHLENLILKDFFADSAL